MQLTAQTLPVADLPAGRLPEMLDLMDSHYEGVTAAGLRADLAAKDRVILLTQGDALCGFSTQVQFDHEFRGRRVRVVFSGDTIIDRRHWGSSALALAWGRMMLDLLAREPATELYWLLTSKGYKTYRFLTVFFRRFEPGLGQEPDAAAHALLDDLASARFGPRYDAARGILAADPDAQRLRPGVAELDDRRLRDPQVAFFQQRNPGHAKGDELVCLARFLPDNLQPYILRQLLAVP